MSTTVAKKKAARKNADKHRGRQADRVIELLKQRFPLLLSPGLARRPPASHQ